jgi:hypothetical protein
VRGGGKENERGRVRECLTTVTRTGGQQALQGRLGRESE